jgi:hypothetical protein
VTRDEWLAAVAERLGIEPPSPEDLDTLLDVASEAAHASERQSAPLTCWLIGCAGVAPAEALRLVRDLRA